MNQWNPPLTTQTHSGPDQWTRPIVSFPTSVCNQPLFVIQLSEAYLESNIYQWQVRSLDRRADDVSVVRDAANWDGRSSFIHLNVKISLLTLPSLRIHCLTPLRAVASSLLLARATLVPNNSFPLPLGNITAFSQLQKVPFHWQPWTSISRSTQVGYEITTIPLSHNPKVHKYSSTNNLSSITFTSTRSDCSCIQHWHNWFASSRNLERMIGWLW